MSRKKQEDNDLMYTKKNGERVYINDLTEQEAKDALRELLIDVDNAQHDLENQLDVLLSSLQGAGFDTSKVRVSDINGSSKAAENHAQLSTTIEDINDAFDRAGRDQ